jgi:hypothetical protein
MTRVKKETRSRILEEREQQRVAAMKRFEHQAAQDSSFTTPRRSTTNSLGRPTPTPSRWAKIQQNSEQESLAATTSPTEEQSTAPPLTAGTSTTVNSTAVSPTEETSYSELNSIPTIVPLEATDNDEDTQTENETSYLTSLPHDVIIISSTEPTSCPAEDGNTESLEHAIQAPEVIELLTSPVEENAPSLVTDSTMAVAQDKWMISDSHNNMITISLFDGDLTDEEDV